MMIIVIVIINKKQMLCLNSLLCFLRFGFLFPLFSSSSPSTSSLFSSRFGEELKDSHEMLSNNTILKNKKNEEKNGISNTKCGI